MVGFSGRVAPTTPWPGNIRQLRNAIENAMLFCDGDTIEIGHLPSEVAS